MQVDYFPLYLDEETEKKILQRGSKEGSIRCVRIRVASESELHRNSFAITHSRRVSRTGDHACDCARCKGKVGLRGSGGCGLECIGAIIGNRENGAVYTRCAHA